METLVGGLICISAEKKIRLSFEIFITLSKALQSWVELSQKSFSSYIGAADENDNLEAVIQSIPK